MTTGPSPDLLRGVAHLLRTPLGVILGMAGTLRDYDHRFTADQRVTYLGEILLAAEEMRDALDGVSLLARAMSGSLPCTLVALPPSQAVTQGAAALASVWGAGSVTAAPAAGGDVTADPERLRQALEALARALPPAAGAAIEVVGDALRIGPVAPRGSPEDVRAALDPPSDNLDPASLVARPGAWPLLLARLLVEAQGGRLHVTAAPAGPAAAGFMLAVHLPAASG